MLAHLGCTGVVAALPLDDTGVLTLEVLSSGDLVLSLDVRHDSYGLKLALTGTSEELVPSEEAGDTLSRLLSELCLWLDLRLAFSAAEMSLGFGESAPIALQVCANSARGLFLASNCNKQTTKLAN